MVFRSARFFFFFLQEIKPLTRGTKTATGRVRRSSSTLVVLLIPPKPCQILGNPFMARMGIDEYTIILSSKSRCHIFRILEMCYVSLYMPVLPFYHLTDVMRVTPLLCSPKLPDKQKIGFYLQHGGGIKDVRDKRKRVHFAFTFPNTFIIMMMIFSKELCLYSAC